MSLAEVDENIRKINAKCEVEGRAVLYASEKRAYDALRKDRELLQAREAELEELERRTSAEATARQMLGVNAGDGVRGEPLPYVLENRDGPSWMQDVAAVKVTGDRDARDRLQRAARATELMQQRAGLVSNTNGSGGEFDPPGWYIDQFVAFARPGRVTANICYGRALPLGVSSVNLPKLSAGTTTAIQATQGVAVSNTDPTTASVSSNVATFAGYNLVSQQFIDQGGNANTDEIILRDLAADLAKQVDVQVLSGSGSSGQLLGILNVSGTNTVQYTDASPAVGGTGKLFAQILKAIGLVATNRYAPADAIVMHPNRWAWIASSSDSQNRPLVVPVGADPSQAVNSVGTANGLTNISDGMVGHIAGVPVYADANVSTTNNTNQDVIFVLRTDDLWLYERQPVLDIMAQPYANSMQVLCRAYQYAAFLPHRYPKAITLIGGLAGNTSTGLVYPPTF